jgi:hypothetical protein
MSFQSKLSVDGFNRYPLKMKQETAHSDASGWFYEEPFGLSVCSRLDNTGKVLVFKIPRRAIETYFRHLARYHKQGKGWNTNPKTRRATP